MSDKGTVIIGLAILLVAAAFPVWYGFLPGKRTAPPVIEKPAGETKCVEDTDYMTARHMDLLNTWRDEVVREGKRTHVSKDGRKFEMSLTRTCMKCHVDREQSCDRCHNYMAVHPYCWDCHLGREKEK